MRLSLAVLGLLAAAMAVPAAMRHQHSKWVLLLSTETQNSTESVKAQNDKALQEALRESINGYAWLSNTTAPTTQEPGVCKCSCSALGGGGMAVRFIGVYPNTLTDSFDCNENNCNAFTCEANAGAICLTESLFSECMPKPQVATTLSDSD